MKKSEFLNAVKGHMITFGWETAYDVNEKGRRTVEGLPESVKEGVHPNQVYAWLKEEFEPELRDHPALKEEQDRYMRFMNYEDETGWYHPDASECREWVDWYEQHPYEVFQC